MAGRIVLDETAMAAAFERMTANLSAAVSAGEPVYLIGIREGGDVVAERLSRSLATSGRDVSGLGAVDATLYRDDFGHRRHWPTVKASEIDGAIDEQTIVLCDDVLFTGRTVRAALSALLDYGRPQRVLLAVLLDRGYRELPICADVVGKRLDAPRDVLCRVAFRERGATHDAAFLEEAG